MYTKEMLQELMYAVSVKEDIHGLANKYGRESDETDFETIKRICKEHAEFITVLNKNPPICYETPTNRFIRVAGELSRLLKDKS